MKGYIKSAAFLFLILLASIFLISCEKTLEEKWQEQYDLGTQYLSEGSYEEAIWAFNMAIQVDNKKADAYIGLQKAYLEIDNPVEAIKALYLALGVTDSREIQEELSAFYDRYSFVCQYKGEEKEVSTDNLFTLRRQADMQFDDEKHTIHEIVLHDNQLDKDYVLAAVGLKSAGYWDFSEDYFRIVAQHDDKLLVNVWYGPGGTDTFIYSILDNTVKELDEIGKLTGYDQKYLDGSENFVFGTSLVYDVGSEQSLYWYDWNGNKIYDIEDTGGYMFFNNKIYYALWTLKQDESYQSINSYDYYSADLDGQNPEYIGSIKYKDGDYGLYAFFWDNGLIEYEYKDINGERNTRQIHVDELNGEVIVP